MPQQTSTVSMPRHTGHNSDVDCCRSVDIRIICGVNKLTLVIRLTLGADGADEARQQALKEERPPRRGHAQSDAREGAGSKVSGKRVLRSARRRAGHVRDAAA